LWKKESWILHQDNATVHNALDVKQFLVDKSIPVLEPPLFIVTLPVPQSENCVETNSFRSVDEVKLKTADLLKTASPDNLPHCFEHWKFHIQRCTDEGEGGEYVEEHGN
jgi:hypothetical protein